MQKPQKMLKWKKQSWTSEYEPAVAWQKSQLQWPQWPAADQKSSWYDKNYRKVYKAYRPDSCCGHEEGAAANQMISWYDRN